jgi:uncharacterized RDD family membrane protein YckC
MSLEERVSLFIEGTRRRRRDIVTPEGVTMPVEIATFGERATAFILDVALWFVASIVLVLLLLLIAGPLLLVKGAFTLFAGALLFASFLIRNFYFIHFELAWRGATPGKRMVGLRVIDRRGGPLRPAAVVARNLTREIEVFLPLSLLSAPGVEGGWGRLATFLWLLLFSLLPLFNRERLRAGDLIGGTLVVVLPRRMLLADLVEGGFAYEFTERQLGAYGAFELQILEELLRRPEGLDTARARRDVADRICRRIGWTAPVPDADVARFLRDFYAAERAWLEREQLYGRVHADKGG